MPFEPRYHAKHIHFLAKIPQKCWAENIHIFANFWPISSKLRIFTITDVTNLMMNFVFLKKEYLLISRWREKESIARDLRERHNFVYSMQSVEVIGLDSLPFVSFLNKPNPAEAWFHRQPRHKTSVDLQMQCLYGINSKVKSQIEIVIKFD